MVHISGAGGHVVWFGPLTMEGRGSATLWNPTPFLSVECQSQLKPFLSTHVCYEDIVSVTYLVINRRAGYRARDQSGRIRRYPR